MTDDVVRKLYPLVDSREKPEDEPEYQPEVESLDFDNSPLKFKLDGPHEWIQQGYFIHCSRCSLEHGVFIGPDKLLYGTDDKGLPILKLRSEVGMA